MPTKFWSEWFSHATTELETLHIQLIASTSPELLSGPIDLEDIFTAQNDTFAGHRSLVQVVGKSSFVIWSREVFDTAQWNLEDAVAHTHSILRLNRPQPTTFMFTLTEKKKEETKGYKTHLISMISLESEGAQSVSLSYTDRCALNEEKSKKLGRRSSFVVRNLPFLLTSVLLFTFGSLLAATPAILRHRTQQADIWLKWSIPYGSNGLQHQLQYTYPHPNFTDWATTTNHDDEDWIVRLDDQSMIPSNLLHKDEVPYQEWYQRRYPEFYEAARSKAYLNESFWLEPKEHLFSVDHQFHITHCILVLKRYWRAREDNKHVCPRDVDHAHMNHCFTVLEELAIPDFEPQGKIGDGVVSTELVWLVNACF